MFLTAVLGVPEESPRIPLEILISIAWFCQRCILHPSATPTPAPFVRAYSRLRGRKRTHISAFFFPLSFALLLFHFHPPFLPPSVIHPSFLPPSVFHYSFHSPSSNFPSFLYPSPFLNSTILHLFFLYALVSFRPLSFFLYPPPFFLSSIIHPPSFTHLFLSSSLTLLSFTLPFSILPTALALSPFNFLPPFFPFFLHLSSLLHYFPSSILLSPSFTHPLFLLHPCFSEI